jgi:hypothetical protein
VSDVWTSQTSRASSQQIEPEPVAATSHQNEQTNVIAAPQQEILITDDGRTVEAPKSDLICPFCQKEYRVMITTC